MTGNSDDLKLVSVEVMKAELLGRRIMDENSKNMDGNHLRHSPREEVQDPWPRGWETEVGASVHREASTKLSFSLHGQPTSLRAGPVPGLPVNAGDMKG